VQEHERSASVARLTAGAAGESREAQAGAGGHGIGVEWH
jgi:hypothetical protein